MGVRSIGILLLVVLAGSLLHAQTQDFDEGWRWARFTVESGLPSDRVQGILETPDGTVWAAAVGGLAWYDGFQWNVIGQSMGLPQATSVSIPGALEDSVIVRCDTDFYIGTRDGFRLLGIDRADYLATLADRSILVFQRPSLYRYEAGVLKPYFPLLTKGKTLSVWTAGDRVWVDVLDGIYRRKDGEWTCVARSRSMPFGLTAFAANASGSGIFVVQFPEDQRGLYEWTDSTTPARNLTENPDNVRAIDISPAGEALVVYESEDTRIRRNGVWSPLRFGPPEIRDIRFVRFRPNGDLWVGTEHGLFLYKRSSSRWTSWRHASPDLRNSVNEILQTRDGSIWLGTSHGIEIHGPSGTKEITSIDGMALDVITGMCEDLSGNVWISSGASWSGAYRWNGTSWKFFGVSPDSGGMYIHKIRRDLHGRLWFLGLGKHFPPMDEKQPGAYVLDDGSFVPWGKQQGLLHGRVYAFAEGNDGALWFGTFGGLSRWRDGRWTYWTTNNGLHSPRVFTIAIDRRNTVWFADFSDGNGLGYIGSDDSVHYYTSADGLVDDRVWDLKVDSYGKLWISTRGGLSCFDNGTWSTFDEKSGLPHPDLWPVLPLDSEVYVGTIGKGTAIFRRQETTTPNPRILLQEPLASGDNVLLRWTALAYWGEVSSADILTRLRINDGPWSAWEKRHVVALDEVVPGTYSYEVQAKGVFGNYAPEGVRGTYVVPLPLHLRPAFLIPTAALVLIILSLGAVLLARKRRHDLDLRKSEEKFRTVTEMTSSAILIYHHDELLFVNSGAEDLTGYGKDELLGLRLADLVEPADWETMKKHELDGTGSTSAPHRYEVRVRRKDGSSRWADLSSGWIKFQGTPVRLATAVDITERKQAEEKLRLLASELSLTEERERRRMASYLHDVIGQTLALCKLKIRGLQRSGASPGSALQELRDLIDQSIHNTQSLTFELCPPILYELSFEAAVEWLTERMKQQSGVEFRCLDDRQPKPLSEEVRVILFQAVREILVNVVKHAQARCVEVQLGRRGPEYVIVIRDDGVGFDLAQKNPQSGGGFGLFNIRQRLTYLHGRLEVESKPGSGTRVTIAAPLSPPAPGAEESAQPGPAH